MNKRYRLALDLGTASSCLAVIEIDRDSNFKNLLMVDDVILSEPIEHTKNGMVTSNSIRRACRLARRQIRNRKSRLKKIAHVFKLLRVTAADVKVIKNSDVYELRVKAQKGKISLAEFCRVCFYLAKHRGYKGDLKEGDIKKRIAQTEALLNDEKSFAEVMLERKISAAKNNAPWYKTDDAGTFIYRKDVENEFETAFRKQAEFYPELNQEYTIVNENYFADLKGKTSAAFFDILHSTIFYQRPIKWKLDSVGKCSLAKDKFRTSTGQLAFQKYRIAKKLSDLRLVNRKDPSDARCLTKEEMRKIFDFVCTNDKMYSKINTYPLYKVYSLIDVDKKLYRFNFETSLDDGSTAAALKGLSTNRVFRDCGVFDEWNALAYEVQECVIEFLTNVTKFADIQENTDGNIREQIQKLTKNIPNYEYWLDNVFDFIKLLKNKEVFYSADFKLEHGRASYCSEVLQKLTDYLLDGGQEFEFIEKFYPNKPQNGILRTVKELQKDNSLLNNPVITRVLMQLERQLKNVISKYGNPTEVIVELARDLKHSLKDRSILETQNKNTEKDRIRAVKDLENQKVVPSNYNIEKWLLWKENGGICPYCGKSLNSGKAFSPETEIDHIIPRAWGGANTYSNKVLCCTKCNKEKGDSTPYLWSLKAGVKINFNYTEMLAKKLYKKMSKKDEDNDPLKSIYASQAIKNQKALNLLNENNSDDFKKHFSDRQKHQTAWLTKVVLDWLKDICNDVKPSFGELTAYIRQRYGFANILPEVRLIEQKDLYKKSGGKIDNTAQWKKIFLERLKYKDIENISPDAKDAEVLLNIKNTFAIYCKELDKSPNQIDKDENKFAHFMSELRTRSELIFDKRCDHRHHIVDAVVIGLCNQRVVQKANEYAKINGSLYKANEIGERFEPFQCKKAHENLFPLRLKEELKQRLLHYVPWHKPDRDPSGELFKQNAYNIKEKNNVKRFVSRVNIDDVLAEGEKYIEAVVAEEYTKKLMLQALQNGEKRIFINGNQVKKIRVFYKNNSLVEYGDKDIELKMSNGGKKYYQNSGYACTDFDKNTGKRIEVIPYWKYLKIKEIPIPDNVVRVFKNDIIYHEK